MTGWWFQPPRKILVNWDDYSQYMGKYKMFQTTNQMTCFLCEWLKDSNWMYRSLQPCRLPFAFMASWRNMGHWHSERRMAAHNLQLTLGQSKLAMEHCRLQTILPFTSTLLGDLNHHAQMYWIGKCLDPTINLSCLNRGQYYMFVYCVFTHNMKTILHKYTCKVCAETLIHISVFQTSHTNDIQ